MFHFDECRRKVVKEQALARWKCTWSARKDLGLQYSYAAFHLTVLRYASSPTPLTLPVPAQPERPLP